VSEDVIRRVAGRISNTGLIVDMAWQVNVACVLDALTPDDLLALAVERGVLMEERWVDVLSDPPNEHRYVRHITGWAPIEKEEDE
jgi:hypothetical protein